MGELVFLKSLIIVLGISAFVVFLLHRIKVPSIVGFLLAGIMLGPYGLHFIKDLDTIKVFAEIGVILLLFTIGLEFSLARFLKMRLEIFGIGGLQVITTVALASLISYQWIGSMKTAVFAGFFTALSSTAIVMKLLSDKAEIDTPHGRTSVGILIFQDLCIVPFMLLIPIMSGDGGVFELTTTFAKAVLIIAAVLLSARWLVPNLLHQVVRTKNRELFVLSILILCFGIALLTSEFGLSLALGAFLAGLVISESEYAHEAISIILPFRDSFNGLFFISVGMLMDTFFFFDNYVPVFTLVLGIIILKGMTGFFSMYVMGRPLRTAVQSSMHLAQIGEFSFVLAVAGLNAGLIETELYQWFLSASILTMIFTPFMIKASHPVAAGLSSRKLLRRLEHMKKASKTEGATAGKSNHVMIIGFGLNGRNLARVLKEAKIPYVILELNTNTVRKMKKEGEPIYYGDGTNKVTLKWLGIKTARTLVIAISDAASCRNIVRTAKKMNRELFIIARTRYIAEVDDLLKLGANEVITEEFETSVEIFSTVLNQYRMPKNEIFNLIDMIREDGYRVLRQTGTTVKKPAFDKLDVISKISIELFRINSTSHALGESLENLKFRKNTDTTIIAIERKGHMKISPDPKLTLKIGDVVFIAGAREDINKAIVFLEQGKLTGLSPL